MAAGSRRAVVLAGVLVAGLLRPPGQQARIAGCFERGSPSARWSLPALYREVSGLTLSEDGRLFLHNDESGVIGAIDPATGRVVGNYRLGPALPVADFEGIAAAGNRLYLVTSRGALYETAMPARGSATGTLPFTVIQTGVGRLCEIEGLGYEPSDQVLLLACKGPRVKSLKGVVAIFRWSAGKKALAEPDRIQVRVDDLAKGQKGRAFSATGIERDPISGHYLMVAGPDRAIAEIDRSGRVLGAWPLRGKHSQAEGIAVTPAGDVLVSDEGVPGPGTVTVYACR